MLQTLCPVQTSNSGNGPKQTCSLRLERCAPVFWNLCVCIFSELWVDGKLLFPNSKRWCHRRCWWPFSWRCEKLVTRKLDCGFSGWKFQNTRWPNPMNRQTVDRGWSTKMSPTRVMNRLKVSCECGHNCHLGGHRNLGIVNRLDGEI